VTVLGTCTCTAKRPILQTTDFHRFLPSTRIRISLGWLLFVWTSSNMVYSAACLAPPTVNCTTWITHTAYRVLLATTTSPTRGCQYLTQAKATQLLSVAISTTTAILTASLRTLRVHRRGSSTGKMTVTGIAIAPVAWPNRAAALAAQVHSPRKHQ
jgi:MFS family permease